jgi:hypothetical protein
MLPQGQRFGWLERISPGPELDFSHF